MRKFSLNTHPFKEIIFLETVSSTMDVAFKLAKLGERNTIILANNQWAGRGKDYRVWFSDDKSLSFSIIIDGKSLKKKSLITILASVLVRRGIISYLAIPINLKWPNDIIFKGKKLGGILGENFDEFVIVGVGINVNTTRFPPYLAGATSLKEIVGKDVDKTKLLINIINEFSASYRLLLEGNELLIREWKNACIMIGERVKFKSYNNILEGIITDISDDGALVIVADGQRKKIYSTDELILEENLRSIWR